MLIFKSFPSVETLQIMVNSLKLMVLMKQRLLLQAQLLLARTLYARLFLMSQASLTWKKTLMAKT